MTVFEHVVAKLTYAGQRIALEDPSFYQVGYEEFARRIGITSTQGLPPEVFVRALKTAYRELTGRVENKSVM